jgi:hypothetical protein
LNDAEEVNVPSYRKYKAVIDVLGNVAIIKNFVTKNLRLLANIRARKQLNVSPKHLQSLHDKALLKSE